LNLSRFIAARLSGSKDNASNYSRPVVIIGVVSIVLSLSVMIIATSVVTGFKKSITQKMSGVASHITITNLDNNSSFETKPLVEDPTFMNAVLGTEHIRHIQPYALKHAIIKTKKEIQGILIKGVDNNYDWESFAPNIIEGERINPADTLTRNQVMVTKTLATAMGLKLGDTLYTYYISQPRRILSERVIRNHTASVFYSMIPEDDSGLGMNYTYNTTNKDVFNFFNYVEKDSVSATTPRAVKLKVTGIFETGIYELDQQLVMGSLGLVQDMYGWTPHNISGYEIYVDDFEQLTPTFQAISFITPQELYPSDIRSNYPEIFEWLPAIDVNGIIIVVLMVLVAMMAMLSTLLILIMEKTYIVGILKSLGMSNWELIKTFFWHGTYIYIRGVIIGNIIGIGLVLIQFFWQPLKLDQDSYYLSYVPVHIDWLRYALINVGTFIVCAPIILLPSLVVTKISPVKAIRLD
jgi:lipoprotein-releasing system permease protein